MKTLTLCCGLAALGQGCRSGVGVVILTDDTFKKTKFYSLTLKTVPEETGLAENVRQAKLEFFRDEAAAKPSVLTLTIKIDETEPDIREELYIKIDDVPHKVATGDFRHKQDSHPYIQTVNEFGYIGQSNTVTRTLKSKLFRMRVEFTKEQEAALKACKAVALRAYVGDEALNLNFSKSETKAIRNFFAGVPDETKSN